MRWLNVLYLLMLAALCFAVAAYRYRRATDSADEAERVAPTIPRLLRGPERFRSARSFKIQALLMVPLGLFFLAVAIGIALGL